MTVFETNDKEVDVMLEERKIRQTTDPVHLGFNEQRQPLIRGDAYHYLIARGDQLAFAAEVVRFGFSPSDFAIEIQRVPNKASRHAQAATFAVTVENVQTDVARAISVGRADHGSLGSLRISSQGLSVSRRQ